MHVLKPNFAKRGGFVTVVAQDARTREVLMVAYTDEAGWLKTLETGFACYYSTSRKRSWMKGEESGNFQHVVEVFFDCDGDALIYLVEPQGEGLACHTNARSCFYRSTSGEVMSAPKAGVAEDLEIVEVVVHPRLGERIGFWTLPTLENQLGMRAKVSADESYTRKLLDKGANHCGKKLGEEAVELVIATTSEPDERVICESADLIYHLLVLLMSRGLNFAMVEQELKRRSGMSGLVEKAARPKE